VEQEVRLAKGAFAIGFAVTKTVLAKKVESKVEKYILII
jgi:hypothetical protein